MKLALRFFERFRGLQRVYGQYLIPEGLKANEKGKIESPQSMRRTIHAHVTPDLWAEHLAGTNAIGIVPIDDLAQVHFAAIDVDVYPIDLAAIEKNFTTLKLPLILCRTKSGGAHLYLFFKEAVPAPLAQRKLLEWASRLGFAKSEIFPKQIRLTGPEDSGSWINMPYQQGARSNRYAIHKGKALSPTEFLDYADKMAITRKELEAIVLAPSSEDEMLEEAPPCLVTLAEVGFPEGSRNNALFNCAVYLRKRFPDDWAVRLPVFNNKFMKPPLSDNEVGLMLRSFSKKSYSYKCKDQPICDVCNKEVCKTRDFGVGSTSGPGLEFGTLTRFSGVDQWEWIVEGVNVKLTTSELMNQRLAKVKIAQDALKVMQPMSSKKWDIFVASYMDSAEMVEVPTDTTKKGQIINYLKRFCTINGAGRSLDEILMGRPYSDDQRTYFVIDDFLSYLTKSARIVLDIGEMFPIMRQLNGESHRNRIKGQVTSYWSIPRFDAQTEDFEVPRKPPEEAM